jgi:hypothetical protein
LIYDLIYTYKEERKYIDSKGKVMNATRKKKDEEKVKKSPVQFD